MTRRQIATTVTAATCAMVLAAATAPAWARAEVETLVQLEKYCTASWRNAHIAPQEWEDCTQQTLVDLLSRIPREQLGVAIRDANSYQRRELTRSIWCTVQRARRARKFQSLEPSLFPDETDAKVGESLEQQELRDILLSDEAGLTDRQQQVLQHCLDGLSVAEVAQAMDLPPARVSDEKYKSIQKLRSYLVDRAELCV